MSDRVQGKAILISEGEPDALSAWVSGLDLPKRALSLPLEAAGTGIIPSFVELWGDREGVRALALAWPFPARGWMVAEFVPHVYQRSWPSGQASPGLRLVSSIQRRPGMTRDEFSAYWRGPHTEVALGYTVPVWHYNQNIVMEAFDPDSREDGFVGMHFRNAEELRARWQDHPAEAARGEEDAARFMAVDRSESVTTIETVWAKGE